MQQLKRVNLPSTSGTNPDHQRYHFIDLGAGDARGNKQFTRRKNRQAQARGFRNFKAMLQHLMALHAQQARAAGIR